MNEPENKKESSKAQADADSGTKDATTKKTAPAAKPPAVTKPAAAAPAGNRLGVFVGLLALIVALLAAAGSYYLWQQQGAADVTDTKRNAQLSSQQKALQERIDQTRNAFTESRGRVDTQLSQLEQQQTDLQDQIATLVKRSGRLRNDWFVAEAEYLIRLANHRLLLDRDVTTALVALQAADQRLQETGDPALLPARKALANDMRKLKGVQQLDIPGLSVQLSALVSGVNRLPLATPDPNNVA